MQVLHIFEEDDPIQRMLHMKYWFGHPEVSPVFIEKDDKMVCYCGGRLVPLKRNPKDASDVQVGAVWHQASWLDEIWASDWEDDE